MDDSVIDLCDSDSEPPAPAPSTKVNNGIHQKCTAPNDSDDASSSASSSSSDDSHLWKAGGFLKGSPPRKEEVKKGNYFKELRAKYGDEGKRKGKMGKRRGDDGAAGGKQFGSPIVSLEIDDPDDAGEAESLKVAAAADKSAPNKNGNNLLRGEPDTKSTNERKRPFSPISRQSESKEESPSPMKKQRSSAGKDVECIEIDLSDSDSSSDDAAPKKVAAKSIKPLKSNKAPAKYDCSEDEDSDSTTEFAIRKKPPLKSTGSDDGSSHSSSTIPLSSNKKAPAKKEDVMPKAGMGSKKKGKGRVSFNNSDDVEFFDTGVPADVTFDTSYGGFDEDDDGPPSKSGGKSRPKKKPMSKPKATSRMEVLEIDSDDSSSGSSAELFTPRPFKKKAKKEQPQSTAKADGKKCPNSASSSASKLLTPSAYSPAMTSPTLGAYAKKQVPTPAIPAMSASLVKEIGGKLYPDLTHNFLIALTSHARRTRHNSFQRASFDTALRSIVVISMFMRPLRSAEAARRLKGVGGAFYDLLKESVSGGKGKRPFAPAVGRFSCVAAAALVALLELEEASASVASANGPSFPMEDLIRKINELLDSRANTTLSQSAEKYLQADNLDPGWGQVKKLAAANAASDLGGPFIKERKKKDACASGRIYELLDSGRELARKLRQLAQAGPAQPGPLRQLPNDTVDEEFGNVTMSMDLREGGGGGKSLHKMCDQLDIRGVPYVVRELKIADYIFFVGDKLAPILIERKSAEDVAGSLADGRWERQKRAMLKAQYVLGGGPARRCQICYLIEGDAAKKTVHGGNVGRRTWFQSLEDVEAAVDQLPSQGFSVLKSKGILDTIGILAKVAQDVSWKAKNGSIDANFTYKQFLSRVKVLADEIGDAPTSQEHMNPAPPVVVNEEHMSQPSSTTPTNDDAASPQADAQDNSQPEHSGAEAMNSEEAAELKRMSMAQLKERCKERDEKISGKKDELVARLLKPRKPEILIMRARRKEYCPKVPSSNAALMVALLLNHVPGTQGMSKERLMVLAEETGVSKESMSGDGGFYDGWSGMSQMLNGDPALVRREKGHRYSLTTQPPETSGRAVAHALHIVAHREGLCNCSNPPE